MTVNDLSTRVRQRPHRGRPLLSALFWFTMGMVAAAGMFWYASQVPIPLKESPTRADADIIERTQLSQQEEEARPELSFRETLRRRSEGVLPESQTEPIPPPPDAQAYYVVAGTYEQADQAQALGGEIKEGLAELEAEIEIRPVRGAIADQQVHKVLIGPFGSSNAADGIRGQLALLGINTRIERLPLAAP